jgi:hypothetical protein
MPGAPRWQFRAARRSRRSARRGEVAVLSALSVDAERQTRRGGNFVRFFRRGGSFERLRDRGGALGTAEVAILRASSVEVAVSCEFSPEVAILGRFGAYFRTGVPSRGKKCSRLPPRAHRRTRLPFRGQECTELPPCGGLTAGNRRLAARGLPDARRPTPDTRRPTHADQHTPTAARDPPPGNTDAGRVASECTKAPVPKNRGLVCARYWDRTSDLFRVREARYRCANRAGYIFCYVLRGEDGIRTRVHGFAGRCLTTRPPHHVLIEGLRAYAPLREAICERLTGFEPATSTLARWCSTS